MRRLLAISVAVAALNPVPHVAAALPGSPHVQATLAGHHNDFNGDGYPDLAVGAPYDSFGGTVGFAGSMNDLFGSADGLTPAGSHLWSQATEGIEGDQGKDDLFAADLASGDFNGDGYGDVSAGTPLDDVARYTSAGSVNVIYGSPAGLTSEGDQLWSRDSDGIEGGLDNVNFGSSVGAGDFNADGFDDLAIGSSFQEVSGKTAAGSVNVLYGSSGGLSAVGSQFWTQDSAGILGEPGDYDELGTDLKGGDFNGDGFGDLAMGARGDTVGRRAAAGAVNVLYGSSVGLTAEGNQLWSQNSPEILGDAERGDLFGYPLAAGDLDGDGVDDLAVAVPSEGVDNRHEAGVVNVILGSLEGLTSKGNSLWSQNTDGVLGKAEGGDHFGHSLAIGDFDADGHGDLAIGVSHEGVHRRQFAGAANVIYGGPAGPTADRNQLWTQDSPGIQGESEGLDFFGWAVSSADFDSDGLDDLVVGASGEGVHGIGYVGAINVIYGSAGGLSASGNQLWSRASPGMEGDLSGTFGRSLG